MRTRCELLVKEELIYMHIIFLCLSCFLETDRFKCGVCDVSNMVLDMYNIMFEMNNRGETP